MNVRRIFVPCLVFAVVSPVWVGSTNQKNERDVKTEKALTDLSRILYAYEIQRLHWLGLERESEFKPVIENLFRLPPVDLEYRIDKKMVPLRGIEDTDLTEFERIALGLIQKGEKEVSLMGTEQQLQFAKGIRLEGDCIACHSQTPTLARSKSGDLHAFFSVTIRPRLL